MSVGKLESLLSGRCADLIVMNQAPKECVAAKKPTDTDNDGLFESLIKNDNSSSFSSDAPKPVAAGKAEFRGLQNSSKRFK